MEDIYITNVKVQSVYCIKDAYGTLVWKTHLIDSSYKGGIWNTCVEDPSRRLIWKTSLEDSFYKHYKRRIWNTRVEDSTGRLVLKICLEDSFYKHYKGHIWKTRLEDLSGIVVWTTFIEDSYGILMFIYSKYFIWQNVLISWERIEMFGRLALNISSTISILTVCRI